MKKKLLFITFICVTTQFLRAQNLALTETNAPTEGSVSQEKIVKETEEKDFSISGFVDAYYQYNFNEKNTFPTSFTEEHNSFTPSMANVVFSKEGKFGFVADIAFGPRAEVANGNTGTTLSAIKQLYISYAPSDKVNFTFGNYGTHVGYEIIDSPGNINYSTSYMFSNGPFYHTGLKADFTLSENFGAMVGIFNDTDTKIDVVGGKHVGAQLSYSKNGLDAFLNYIGGKDDDSNPEDEIFGHQVDLTATYAVSDKLDLGLNTTVKTSKGDETASSSWFGTALYANYACNEKLTLASRVEHIGDDDGLISGVASNSIFSFTLSGNIHLGPIILIPEFRIDTAAEDSFLASDDAPSSTNAAFIFASIYEF